MIVTYELTGVCQNGHAVQGVTVVTVRVNLHSLVNTGAGSDLVLMAGCPHQCGGPLEVRHIQLDAESKRKVDERRAAIRVKRLVTA